MPIFPEHQDMLTACRNFDHWALGREVDERHLIVLLLDYVVNAQVFVLQRRLWLLERVTKQNDEPLALVIPENQLVQVLQQVYLPSWRLHSQELDNLIDLLISHMADLLTHLVKRRFLNCRRTEQAMHCELVLLKVLSQDHDELRCNRAFVQIRWSPFRVVLLILSQYRSEIGPAADLPSFQLEELEFQINRNWAFDMVKVIAKPKLPVLITTPHK
jgi:hypothetical protein